MEAELRDLRAAVVEALHILRGDANPLDVRAGHADAVLTAALWRLRAVPIADAPTEEEEPDGSAERASPPAADDRDADNGEAIVFPEPRPLAAYRQERRLTIPAFTDWLGILHHEYAAVVRRLPVDRRLRDQIAFKLGVPWREIAEFMPAPAPAPRPRPVPKPAPAGARPPLRPWFLFDEDAGTIISGPHHEPIPANGWILGDPITWMPTNLVTLHDASGMTEEDRLPPEGYSAAERAQLYGDED